MARRSLATGPGLGQGRRAQRMQLGSCGTAVRFLAGHPGLPRRHRDPGGALALGIAQRAAGGGRQQQQHAQQSCDQAHSTDPSSCSRASSQIRVSGSIDRSDFDMRQWQLALADRVWLLARLQLDGSVE